MCDTNSDDFDNDGVIDTADNCPTVYNPTQDDHDSDDGDTTKTYYGGDACDLDDDNDGILDSADYCPFLASADNADQDSDGLGNPCDDDDDGDGVNDL